MSSTPQWKTLDDIFEELGLGQEDVSLKKLVEGQREINGKFYRAIGLILHLLKEVKPQTSQVGEESLDTWSVKLAEAHRINEEAPGPPPGCPPPKGGS